MKDKRQAIDMVRDYATYMAKPFSYRELMEDLGISRRNAIRVIGVMYRQGELQQLNKDKGVYIKTKNKLLHKRKSWDDIPIELQERWRRRLQMVL